LIFVNTKEEVDNLSHLLKEEFQNVGALHGGMFQKKRNQILDRFKNHEIKILVASDVLARGIDVFDIKLVINYDLANDKNTFIHRIGRTNRQEQEGKNIVFINETQLDRFNSWMDGNIELELINEIPELSYQALKQYKLLLLENTKRGSKHNPDDITKIYIQAGKKQKIRNLDIVGALLQLDHLESEDLGVIIVEENFTTIDILNNKGQETLTKLENHPIKKKIRKTSIYRKEA
ncbi:MAG: helicase-related protein, partial [Bacilli bacterium]